MQQLQFEELLSDNQATFIAETSSPSRLNLRGKPDHELLHILGFEVGKQRGSIHELVKSLQTVDPRIEALIELTRRYLNTPLPKGTAFGCPHDIFLHYQYMRELKQEHFIVLLLNTKHEVIDEITVSIGTVNRSLVTPREVFAEAIKQHAAALVCLHNHPSGDSSASRQDIEITRRLQKSGQIIGIQLIDHLIIGNNSYTSLADESLI